LTITLARQNGDRITEGENQKAAVKCFQKDGDMVQARAFQLIQPTRPEQERGLVLKRFREQIKGGERFTFDFYR
jgi:hypothetical protein